jgi:hypothetical protein
LTHEYQRRTSNNVLVSQQFPQQQPGSEQKREQAPKKIRRPKQNLRPDRPDNQAGTKDMGNPTAKQKEVAQQVPLEQ